MNRRRALVVVVALVALAAGVGVGFLSAWRLKPRPRSEVAVETVVAQVKRIARLATVEVHEAQIVRVDEGTPVFYLFESRKNALLLVKGRVLAGVDLEKAKVDVRISGEERVLEVTLPPAQILAVDPEVEFYDEQSGWMNPITPQDRTAWIKLAKAELERAAIAGQVREKASAHARTLIEGFGAGLGFRVVVNGAPGVALAPAPEGP